MSRINKNKTTERVPISELGSLLVESGIVSLLKLEEALSIQKETGKFLGQILVEKGYVKQDVIVQFLVHTCKIPHLSLLDYEISKEVLAMIPKEICLKYQVLPIDRLGRILTVAMVDPLNSRALEEIRRMNPDLRVKPILCNYNHFNTVSKLVFGNEREVAMEIKETSISMMKALAAIPGNERVCLKVVESKWFVENTLEIPNLSGIRGQGGRTRESWVPLTGYAETPEVALKNVYSIFIALEEFRVRDPKAEGCKYYRKVGSFFIEVQEKDIK